MSFVVGALFTVAAWAEEPAPTTPVTAPVPTDAPPVVTVAPVSVPQVAPAATVEQRETYDAAGHRVRQLILDGGALATEKTWTYDAKGRVATAQVVDQGVTTVESFTYDDAGNVLTRTVTADGKPVRSETTTWAKDKPVQRVIVADGVTTTTTWTWDAWGTPASIETRDASGALIERTIADRAAPPPVPFKPAGLSVGFETGLSTNSDVQVSDLALGFSIARKPDPKTYDRDPVEMKVSGLYEQGRSKGEKTNDHSNLRFGLDYNHIFPSTTVFLFGDIDRNPVANMNIDVELAPIGVKYDFVDRSKGGLLDLSVAPVWNYRSVVVDAGGDCFGEAFEVAGNCDFSRVRGSMRGRFGYEKGGLKFSNTVEFLPVLNPESGTIVEAIDAESVLRDKLAFSIKLSQRFTLTESLQFTRDMLMAQQADCATDPENLLCDGMSLQTGTTLAFDYDFTPKD